jgi:hypothetical protein
MLREMKELYLTHQTYTNIWDSLLIHTDPYYLETSLRLPRYSSVHHHCLPIVTFADCQNIDKLKWYLSLGMDETIVGCLHMQIADNDR